MFTLNLLFCKLTSFHNVSLQQCSWTDSAIITRSSAYNNSQGHPVLNSWGNASRTKTKRSGLRTEPWCTPTFRQKLSLKQFSIHTLLLALWYIAWPSWKIHLSTPSLLKAHQRICRGTLPKAFSRLTKAKYRFLFFAWNFSWYCLKINIASVVPCPCMNPNYISSVFIMLLIYFSTTLSSTFIIYSRDLRPL